MEFLNTLGPKIENVDIDLLQYSTFDPVTRHEFSDVK